MRISHQYRFVFFAMPRTGSTTARNVLDPYSDIKSVHISEISRDFPFYHHISALELKNIFEKNDWDWPSYHRFCVIRNPYDRVVSLYHHHQKMILKFSQMRPSKFKDRITKIRMSLKPKTFESYVMNLNPTDRLTTSLKHFICDKNGNFLVDDVLMFEKLHEELPAYLNKIGLQITADDIPHLNASEQRQDYREYYDDKTRQKVSELYSYEIERFKYLF